MMLLRPWLMKARPLGVVRTGFARRGCQTVLMAPSKWQPLPLTPAALTFVEHGCLRLYCRLFSAKPGPLPASSECLQSALARTGSVREVLDVWEAHKDSPYSHNVVRSCLYYSLKAAAVEQLSSPELFQVPRFQRFCSHLISEVPEMSANSAVKCLYNCAQFDFHYEPLSVLLVDVCTQKSQYIPSVSTGILLWSLKRLDLLSLPSTRPLLAHLIDNFQDKLVSGEKFRTQSLANILWALASSNNLSQSLGERVAKILPRYMNEFDFHSLSLSLWSLTHSKASLNSTLLDTAGKAAAGFLQRERSVPNTVHCCWAFASAEYHHQQFCEAVSQCVLRESSSSPLLTPRLLSSVAWMCAKVGHYDAALLDCIATRALYRLTHFNAQDLGNLMYAYTQLNYPHQELVREVTERFLCERKLLKDDDACVSIAWANLAIGEYPLPLLEHLMQPSRVKRLVESADQNSLNFLLRLQSLVKTEQPALQLSLPHHSAVLACALTHCRWRHPHSKLLTSIITALSKITGCSTCVHDKSYFTLEALTTTLYFIDIEMILDDRGNPIPIPNHWLNWDNLQSLVESHVIPRSSPKLQALLQNSSSAVGSGGTPHSQSLNLASDWTELVGGAPTEGVAQRVAVEVDGPWHYATNCCRTLGKTLLKHQTLRCQGWTVVSVPYFEWQTLKSEQAQTDYLRAKLFTSDH